MTTTHIIAREDCSSRHLYTKTTEQQTASAAQTRNNVLAATWRVATEADLGHCAAHWCCHFFLFRNSAVSYQYVTKKGFGKIFVFKLS